MKKLSKSLNDSIVAKKSLLKIESKINIAIKKINISLKKKEKYCYVVMEVQQLMHNI